MRAAVGARALVLALSLTTVAAGCSEGTPGPCPGGECPQIPGCEGQVNVSCDPDHVCHGEICEGASWICGVEGEGDQRVFGWRHAKAPCSDGNPCTTGDVCVLETEKCQGAPVECKTPPPNVCLDAKQLKAFEGRGTCSGATGCEYAPRVIVCAQGCEQGKCIGEPCAGISCENPPGCHKAGACSEGKCSYEQLPSGTSCKPDDACLTNATCDETGKCNGTPLSCARPHTTPGSGTCVLGTCQGFSCEPGWGHCGTTWDDGCETPLDTVQSCGKCGVVCPGGANASAACVSGKCGLKCNAGWGDCNGHLGDGCEIPIGQPNKCYTGGLLLGASSRPACGTAHCGQKSGADIKSFAGNWHCVWCAHCHHFSNGNSWCLRPSAGYDGRFSDQRTSEACPAFDKVCN